MLNEIVDKRRKQVAENKELFPLKLLERSIYFDTTCISLKEYLQKPDKSGIIAEFKRSSPSRGFINAYADVIETTISYMQAGASALSILTEPLYFSGNDNDLTNARNTNFCPILRKDFIVDEYQVIESKAIGADAILLIASILNQDEIMRFSSLAFQLSLEVIFEVHDEEDLKKIPDKNVIVGVNNRNLKTMKTDINISVELADKIDKNLIKISESGLNTAEDFILLKNAGYSGFLIGEHFMSAPHPSVALSNLIIEINSIEK